MGDRSSQESVKGMHHQNVQCTTNDTNAPDCSSSTDDYAGTTTSECTRSCSSSSITSSASSPRRGERCIFISRTPNQQRGRARQRTSNRNARSISNSSGDCSDLSVFLPPLSLAPRRPQRAASTSTSTSSQRSSASASACSSRENQRTGNQEQCAQDSRPIENAGSSAEGFNEYTQPESNTVQEQPTPSSNIEQIFTHSEYQYMPPSFSAINSQMPVISSHMPAINSHMAAINSHMPAINSQMPAINSQMPAINSQMPTINCQMPTINCQMPTINSQMSAINSHMPAINSQMPAINSHMPAINNQIPATNSHMPAINSHMPAINSRLPATQTSFPTVDQSASTAQTTGHVQDFSQGVHINDAYAGISMPSFGGYNSTNFPYLQYFAGEEQSPYHGLTGSLENSQSAQPDFHAPIYNFANVQDYSASPHFSPFASHYFNTHDFSGPVFPHSFATTQHISPPAHGEFSSPHQQQPSGPGQDYQIARAGSPALPTYSPTRQVCYPPLGLPYDVHPSLLAQNSTDYHMSQDPPQQYNQFSESAFDNPHSLLSRLRAFLHPNYSPFSHQSGFTHTDSRSNEHSSQHGQPSTSQTPPDARSYDQGVGESHNRHSIEAPPQSEEQHSYQPHPSGSRPVLGAEGAAYPSPTFNNLSNTTPGDTDSVSNPACLNLQSQHQASINDNPHSTQANVAARFASILSRLLSHTPSRDLRNGHPPSDAVSNITHQASSARRKVCFSTEARPEVPDVSDASRAPADNTTGATPIELEGRQHQHTTTEVRNLPVKPSDHGCSNGAEPRIPWSSDFTSIVSAPTDSTRAQPSPSPSNQNVSPSSRHSTKPKARPQRTRTSDSVSSSSSSCLDTSVWPRTSTPLLDAEDPGLPVASPIKFSDHLDPISDESTLSKKFVLCCACKDRSMKSDSEMAGGANGGGHTPRSNADRIRDVLNNITGANAATSSSSSSNSSSNSDEGHDGLFKIPKPHNGKNNLIGKGKGRNGAKGKGKGTKQVNGRIRTCSVNSQSNLSQGDINPLMGVHSRPQNAQGLSAFFRGWLERRRLRHGLLHESNLIEALSNDDSQRIQGVNELINCLETGAQGHESSGRNVDEEASSNNADEASGGNSHDTSGRDAQEVTQMDGHETSGGSVREGSGRDEQLTSGGSGREGSGRYEQLTSGGSVREGSGRNEQLTSGGSGREGSGRDEQVTSGGSVREASVRDEQVTSDGSGQEASGRNDGETSGSDADSAAGPRNTRRAHPPLNYSFLLHIDTHPERFDPELISNQIHFAFQESFWEGIRLHLSRLRKEEDDLFKPKKGRNRCNDTTITIANTTSSSDSSGSAAMVVCLEEAETSLEELPEHHKQGSHTCMGCQKPVQDRYVLHVRDHGYWHADCLRCCTCQVNLSSLASCYVRDERVFCRTDYNVLFGLACVKCSLHFKKDEDWMRVAGQHRYHIACFLCKICKRQLGSNERYHLVNGTDIYCTNHYRDLVNGDSADGQHPPKKAKRNRTSYTESQIKFLQDRFNIDSNPDGNELEKIASRIGLKKRVVQVWFQNNRARLKKTANNSKGSNQENKNPSTSNGLTGACSMQDDMAFEWDHSMEPSMDSQGYPAPSSPPLHMLLPQAGAAHFPTSYSMANTLGGAGPVGVQATNSGATHGLMQGQSCGSDSNGCPSRHDQVSPLNGNDLPANGYHGNDGGSPDYVDGSASAINSTAHHSEMATREQVSPHEHLLGRRNENHDRPDLRSSGQMMYPEPFYSENGNTNGAPNMDLHHHHHQHPSHHFLNLINGHTNGHDANNHHNMYSPGSYTGLTPSGYPSYNSSHAFSHFPSLTRDQPAHHANGMAFSGDTTGHHANGMAFNGDNGMSTQSNAQFNDSPNAGGNNSVSNHSVSNNGTSVNALSTEQQNFNGRHPTTTNHFPSQAYQGNIYTFTPVRGYLDEENGSP